MPLVSMNTMMKRALVEGYGLGYFEAWDSYSMEAVLEAAEEEQSPVILGFGGMMADTAWLDNGGVELLGAIGTAIAGRARVPACLLLNEAQSMEQTIKGIDAGFNAVMLDTSAWPWERAVEAVASLVKVAHERGITVEAELGRLPDATFAGIDASAAAVTDPDEAVRFLEATGADCLAVSIGNVHLLTSHYAPVDLSRLEAIHRRVSVPMVIHGGTSFPPQAVPEAIANGVAKFNVGTILKKTFLQAVTAALQTDSETFTCPSPIEESSKGERNITPLLEGEGPGVRLSVHDVLGSHKDTDFLVAGKITMKDKVKELMRLYGSSGRAVEGKE